MSFTAILYEILIFKNGKIPLRLFFCDYANLGEIDTNCQFMCPKTVVKFSGIPVPFELHCGAPIFFIFFFINYTLNPQNSVSSSRAALNILAHTKSIKCSNNCYTLQPNRRYKKNFGHWSDKKGGPKMWLCDRFGWKCVQVARPNANPKIFQGVRILQADLWWFNVWFRPLHNELWGTVVQLKVNRNTWKFYHSWRAHRLTTGVSFCQIGEVAKYGLIGSPAVGALNLDLYQNKIN